MFLVNYAYVGWEDHALSETISDAARPAGLIYRNRKTALDAVKRIIEGALVDIDYTEEQGGINNWQMTYKDEGEEIWTAYGQGGDEVACIVICEVEFAD